MNDNQISSAMAGVRNRLPWTPPRRILVADDEPLIRLLYIRLLADSGHRVDSAENGEVAWQALQLSAYDLLITDQEMPKVSGVDLLKRIYAAHMTLPIIMATGTFPEEEFKRSPWLQPEITLIKPHTATEFLEAVEEMLCNHDALLEQPARSPVCQVRPAPNRLRL